MNLNNIEQLAPVPIRTKIELSGVAPLRLEEVVVMSVDGQLRVYIVGKLFGRIMASIPMPNPLSSLPAGSTVSLYDILNADNTWYHAYVNITRRWADEDAVKFPPEFHELCMENSEHPDAHALKDLLSIALQDALPVDVCLLSVEGDNFVSIIPPAFWASPLAKCNRFVQHSILMLGMYYRNVIPLHAVGKRLSYDTLESNIIPLLHESN